MPSKNMLPKGDRRRSVKAEYRAQRTLAQEREAAQRAAGEWSEAEPRRQGILTADIVTAAASPAPSPWAGRANLVTSGPESGKMPPEHDTQSTPRYSSPYAVEAAAPEIAVLEDLEPEDGVRSLTAPPEAQGLRLDAYLAKAVPGISRARVVLLIEGGQVTVDGEPAKGKQKLKGGESIEIEGDPQPAPLNAVPEDIPLAVVYEDDDLAAIDKPAGMMVHAGSGAPEHNTGTLVNALLYRFGHRAGSSGAAGLSELGGPLRPGIVHRLDKQTSGLILIAKNDRTHQRLAAMFSARDLRKTYIALVHGVLEPAEGTVSLAIARDLVRRTRMTTRRGGAGDARSAVSHYRVLERIAGPYGSFTLVEVRIETGRTHQIRVHMQALGHAVVGDTLYGAPRLIQPVRGGAATEPLAGSASEPLALERNFLHATALALAHPTTGRPLELHAPLPGELEDLLGRLRKPVA